MPAVHGKFSVQRMQINRDIPKKTRICQSGGFLYPPLPWGENPKRGPQPPPWSRKGIFKGEGGDPLPLEWLFCPLFQLQGKVDRRRQNERPPHPPQLIIFDKCGNILFARVIHNKAGRRRRKKTCRWHVFSRDLGGYAAVASILFLEEVLPSTCLDLCSAFE
mgnify:CR=1 FL=1